jgi:hypothetical protein
MARTKKSQASAAKQVKIEVVKSIKVKYYDILGEIIKEILAGNVEFQGFGLDTEVICVGNELILMIDNENRITIKAIVENVRVFDLVRSKRKLAELLKKQDELTNQIKEEKSTLKEVTPTIPKK